MSVLTVKRWFFRCVNILFYPRYSPQITKIKSLQVIRAQKTARRLQMTQSLFLNLSPAYTKEEIH